MRHAAWTVIFLGLLAVMLGELDFFLVLSSDASHTSLLWPALVIGATLAGSGMLLLAGDRMAGARWSRRASVEQDFE